METFAVAENIVVDFVAGTVVVEIGLDSFYFVGKVETADFVVEIADEVDLFAVVVALIDFAADFADIVEFEFDFAVETGGPENFEESDLNMADLNSVVGLVLVVDFAETAVVEFDLAVGSESDNIVVAVNMELVLAFENIVDYFVVFVLIGLYMDEGLVAFLKHVVVFVADFEGGRYVLSFLIVA